MGSDEQTFWRILVAISCLFSVLLCIWLATTLPNYAAAIIFVGVLTEFLILLTYGHKVK